ncbi:MAG TPA: type II secretion protein, partial [Phycisphaerales bacterium]|nr:type II secretion protein [Phycisphaerales bacterium]
MPLAHRSSASHDHSTPAVRHGFTLIEILVVLGVIVLLMGIAIPTLRSARLTSLNTMDLSQIR